MKNISGSETEKNLVKAFAGESMARNRYAIFAKKAKKEGFVQISDILLKISGQERAHSSRLFKFLNGTSLEIDVKFPAYGSGTTLENLQNAAGDENFENSTMYPSFAEKAREEGYSAVAVVFDSIANAEKHHENILSSLIKDLENNSFFEREYDVLWHCIKCGYTYFGKEAPSACPACAHSQAYFEVLGEN